MASTSASESERRSAALSAWSRGTQIAFFVWLGFHLWTLAATSQDRAAFEAAREVDPEAQLTWWGGRIGLSLLGLWVLFPRRRQALPRSFIHSEQRFRLRLLACCIATLFLIYHVVAVGALSRFTVSYDALCAALSSTALGVPLTGFGYLAGVLASSAVAALGAECWMLARGRKGLLPVVWFGCGALALLGVYAVLHWATGAGAPVML